MLVIDTMLQTLAVTGITHAGSQIKSQINKIQINENERLENFGKDSGSLKTVL
jgi:hypothetical protein